MGRYRDIYRYDRGYAIIKFSMYYNKLPPETADIAIWKFSYDYSPILEVAS